MFLLVLSDLPAQSGLDAMVQTWQRLHLYAPDSSASGSSGESLLRSGSSPFGSPILAEPAMVCGPGSPTLPWRVTLLSMGDSHPAGSLLSQVGGFLLSPLSGVV